MLRATLPTQQELQKINRNFVSYSLEEKKEFLLKVAYKGDSALVSFLLQENKKNISEEDYDRLVMAACDGFHRGNIFLQEDTVEVLRVLSFIEDEKLRRNIFKSCAVPVAYIGWGSPPAQAREEDSEYLLSLATQIYAYLKRGCDFNTAYQNVEYFPTWELAHEIKISQAARTTLKMLLYNYAKEGNATAVSLLLLQNNFAGIETAALGFKLGNHLSCEASILKILSFAQKDVRKALASALIQHASIADPKLIVKADRSLNKKSLLEESERIAGNMRKWTFDLQDPNKLFLFSEALKTSSNTLTSAMSQEMNIGQRQLNEWTAYLNTHSLPSVPEVIGFFGNALRTLLPSSNSNNNNNTNRNGSSSPSLSRGND